MAERRINKFVDKCRYARLICFLPQMTGYPRKFPFGFTQERAVVDNESVVSQKILLSQVVDKAKPQSLLNLDFVPGIK